jgi:hypothetical protein
VVSLPVPRSASNDPDDSIVPIRMACHHPFFPKIVAIRGVSARCVRVTRAGPPSGALGAAAGLNLFQPYSFQGGSGPRVRVGTCDTPFRI